MTTLQRYAKLVVVVILISLVAVSCHTNTPTPLFQAPIITSVTVTDSTITVKGEHLYQLSSGSGFVGNLTIDICGFTLTDIRVEGTPQSVVLAPGKHAVIVRADTVSAAFTPGPTDESNTIKITNPDGQEFTKSFDCSLLLSAPEIEDVVDEDPEPAESEAGSDNADDDEEGEGSGEEPELTLMVSGAPGNLVGFTEVFEVTATVGGVYGAEATVAWVYSHDGSGEPGEITDESGLSTTLTAPGVAGDGHKLVVRVSHDEADLVVEEEFIFDVGFCSDGSYDSEADPCVIKTVVQLQVIGSSVDYLAGHYVLGQNIDASETQTWNDGAGFIPLGLDVNGVQVAFTGTFSGGDNEFAIKHLSIGSADTGMEQEAALFWQLGDDNSGAISNLTLDNAKIFGKTHTAALVVRLANGKIENATLQNSHVQLIESSSYFAQIGGLVSVVEPNGVISSSKVLSTDVEVSNSNTFSAGGFVHENRGSIVNSGVSYSTVRVTGNEYGHGTMYVSGFVFSNWDRIENSYVSDSTVSFTGVGFASGFVDSNSGSITDSSVSDSTVRATGNEYGHEIRYASGFVRANGSTGQITDSYVRSATVSVAGSWEGLASGFVDANSGSITGSSVSDSTVTVVVVEESEFWHKIRSGSASGFVRANGIKGEITDSYVSGATVSLTGDGRARGFVASNNGNIVNSYVSETTVTGVNTKDF